MGRFSGMRFLIILEVQHLESRKLQALKSPGHRLRKPTTCGLAIAIATVLCETSSSKVHEVRLAHSERDAATPEIIREPAVLFVLNLAISFAIVLCECPSCKTHLFSFSPDSPASGFAALSAMLERFAVPSSLFLKSSQRAMEAAN